MVNGASSWSNFSNSRSSPCSGSSSAGTCSGSGVEVGCTAEQAARRLSSGSGTGHRRLDQSCRLIRYLKDSMGIENVLKAVMIENKVLIN